MPFPICELVPITIVFSLCVSAFCPIAIEFLPSPLAFALTPIATELFSAYVPAPNAVALDPSAFAKCPTAVEFIFEA